MFPACVSLSASKGGLEETGKKLCLPVTQCNPASQYLKAEATATKDAQRRRMPIAVSFSPSLVAADARVSFFGARLVICSKFCTWRPQTIHPNLNRVGFGSVCSTSAALFPAFSPPLLQVTRTFSPSPFPVFNTECDSACKGGCTGAGAAACVDCLYVRLPTGMCASQCPPPLSLHPVTKVCGAYDRYE